MSQPSPRLFSLHACPLIALIWPWKLQSLRTLFPIDSIHTVFMRARGRVTLNVSTAIYILREAVVFLCKKNGSKLQKGV